MGDLSSKLLNFGYDLVGIFLPGFLFCLLVLIYIIAGFLPDFSLVLSQQSKIQDLIGWNFFTLFLVMMVYVLGLSIKTISMKSWRVTRWLKISPEKPEFFSSEVKWIWEELTRKNFMGDIGNISCSNFMQFGKAIIRSSGMPSLLDTFQTKYTLYRSISTVGGLVIYITILASIAEGIVHFRPIIVYRLFAFMLIGLVLCSLCSGSFKFYWLRWGDTLLVESYTATKGFEKWKN